MINSAKSILCIAVLLFSSLLLAGDRAHFATLGWSPDYTYYAFAQYGVEDGSGFPYAEIYIINVAENSFVKGGILKKRLETDMAVPSGLNVLFGLMWEADSLFRKNHIKFSQPFKVLAQPTEDLRESVTWQEADGATFSLNLRQQNKGKVADYFSSAAFYLELVVNGKTITGGNKRRFRKGVIRYGIDRVMSSPERSVIVVVIKKQMLGFEGPSIRYMVESLVID